MTIADMHAAVASGHAKWVDEHAIVWVLTGLVVRLRPDLPGIPLAPSSEPLVCPTCPGAMPEHCCSCGCEIAEADRWLATNPYDHDIHGDESLHLECRECARQSADDI